MEGWSLSYLPPVYESADDGCTLAQMVVRRSRKRERRKQNNTGGQAPNDPTGMHYKAFQLETGD